MRSGGSIDEALRRAGIWPITDEPPPIVGAECGSIARRLREGRARMVGLVPADDHVAVPAVAILLGRALAGRGARPVAVVDAHGSWTRGSGPGELAGADPRTHLATSWVRDDVALLMARPAPGAALEQLRRTVEEEAAPFAHLVFDLTGFDHLGDELAACKLLDAVVLVARSGYTTTRRIQRRLRDLPSQCVGVLLTGM